MMSKLLLFALLVSVAHAGCPNKCSGHGECGLGDLCACQPRWVGVDCSNRECSYGLSWVTSDDTTNSPSGGVGIVAEGTMPYDAWFGWKTTAISAITPSGANVLPTGATTFTDTGVVIDGTVNAAGTSFNVKTIDPATKNWVAGDMMFTSTGDYLCTIGAITQNTSNWTITCADKLVNEATNDATLHYDENDFTGWYIEHDTDNTVYKITHYDKSTRTFKSDPNYTAVDPVNLHPPLGRRGTAVVPIESRHAGTANETNDLVGKYIQFMSSQMAGTAVRRSSDVTDSSADGVWSERYRISGAWAAVAGTTGSYADVDTQQGNAFIEGGGVTGNFGDPSLYKGGRFYTASNEDGYEFLTAVGLTQHTTTNQLQFTTSAASVATGTDVTIPAVVQIEDAYENYQKTRSGKESRASDYQVGTAYRITTHMGGGTGKHQYTECSSKGTCDRSSGECQCFDGYEGRGCRRQACPNDCSGHGRCLYNNEVDPLYGPTAVHPNSLTSQYWDYKMARQCACDRGWEGNDCSTRICPKGDDPLTDCDMTGGSIADIQKLTFKDSVNKQESGGYFTLSFVDMFGGSYTTKPIELSAKTGLKSAAGDIELALEELPNFAVPNVTVTQSGASTDHEYEVTFVDEANAGLQNLLQCSDISGHSDQKYDHPAVQPRHRDMPVGARCKATSAGVISADANIDLTECDPRNVFAVGDKVYLAGGTLASSGTVATVTSTTITASADTVGYSAGVYLYSDPARVEKEDGAICTSTHVAHNYYNIQGYSTDGVQNTDTNSAEQFKYREHVECSNRGMCDSSSGVCNCFEGFTGEACATQTVFF